MVLSRAGRGRETVGMARDAWSLRWSYWMEGRGNCTIDGSIT